MNTNSQSQLKTPQGRAANSQLLMGSAMWGWNVSREAAFQMLDFFYEKGFRQVDSATNYPINKNPSDFRKAEMILQEWTEVNGVKDLQIIMKIGSLNNLRTSDHNLTKSFILMSLEDYRLKFGDNLHTLMIHWDNRSEREAIEESLEALEIARLEGLQIGLSGIKHPEVYAALNQKYAFDFVFQMKHNLLHSDYNQYKDFHGKRRFITYGINAGGLKLQLDNYGENSTLKARGGATDELHPIVAKVQAILEEANKKAREALTNFNQIGMLYSFYSPDILGILLGCSRLEQLENSIAFYDVLKTVDYEDVYRAIIDARE